MLAGGHALNALPQLATASVNCRVLPEDSPEYVLETLNNVIADPEVKVSWLVRRDGGVPSPMRPDILNAVTASTAAEFPGVPVLPIMVVGATDGRYLRTSGIPCYGIQGFFFTPDDIRFHGRDERMPVKSFYEGEAFLYDLVKRLSTK
jgi:acetylornithine deacetylase/succinyl-diaminopimelate desuccinylase-like protein